MPQLDALRFFAVLGVLVVHNWRPRGLLPGVLGSLDWGGLGVRLFFVLSGFLITGILFGCRTLAEQGAHSSLYYVRQFYARRFLRIFPIYYAVILVAVVVDMHPAREVWPWLVTYTSNVYITLFDKWPGRLGHFWTLAVEEQFYLLWPWLVLFAPRKWLVPAMLIVIPIGPAYRLFAYATFPFDVGAMDFKAGTLTPGSLDSLGIGSLLALVWHSGIPRDTLRKVLSRVVLPAGLLVFVSAQLLFYYRIAPGAFFTFGDLGAALVFAWLVGSAARGFTGLAGAVLELEPLVYLGKITYGIYVFHNLTPLMLLAFFGWIGVPYEFPRFAHFLLTTALTLALASLSWHAFELPINNLKRLFEYAPRASGQAERGTPAEGRLGSVAS